MKNAMKKLLSLMLVAVLLVSAVPFQASAATGGSDVGYYAIPVQIYINETHKGTGNLTVYTDGTQELNESVALDLLSSNNMTNADSTYALTKWASSTGWEGTSGSTSYQWISEQDDATVAAYQLSVYVTETVVCKHTSKTGTVVAPTCTTAGYTSYKCDDCGADCGTANEVAATGHSFGAWVETTAPTTTSKGENTRTCSACGATETSEVAKLTTPTGDTSYVPDDTKNILTVTLDYACDELADHYLYLESNMKWGTLFAETDNSIDTPTRPNYTFAGWYWDSNYDNKVSNNSYVAGSNTEKVTIYARWTRSSGADNTYLYIYTNGKTTSAAKIVDISNYGEYDGKIEIGEALTVARKSYSFSGYNGVYDEASWNGGNFEKNAAQTYVTVNDNGNTDVYLMIWNASTSSSSSSSSSSSTTSTADSSNPKTGDTIYMAATVLAVSAAALVAVYFFMKKRHAA